MLILASVLAGSAFVVFTAFILVFSLQRLLEVGVWVPWYLQVVAIVWLILGFAADFLFNILWGSLIFRERPHEALFSHRVKRHFRDTTGGWRHEKAVKWASFLNAVDPGHV